MDRHPRPALCLICLALAVGGCGKATVAVIKSGPLNPVAPVAPAGAAGQVTKNTVRLGGANPLEDAAAVATAVHPPGQPPQTVVLVDKDELGAALAAALLAGPPLDAPLLYGEAGGVPAATLAALKALAPTGAKALEGAQILTIGGVVAPSGYRARALPATDEAQAALELARVEQGLTGHTVRRALVIDAGQATAFALPAAALAAAFSTPIVLVQRDRLPHSSEQELELLDHPTIYAIGPRAAIGEPLLRTLGRFGTVKRIAGETPAEQSVALARFLEGGFGFGIQEPGHGLAFVDGRDPLDAPPAAELATAGDFAPTLVLEGPSALPQQLISYLENIRGAYSSQVPPVRSLYNHGWIIGGAQAISLAVQDQIDGLLEIEERANATPSPAYAPEGG